MKTSLLAKSSSGEPYKVEFSSNGSELRVFCHCPAGVLHRMCKHKQALIDGDVSMLFDPTSSEQLLQVRSSPEFKVLMKSLEVYFQQLKEVEKAKSELEKREKEIKAAVGRGLSFGFKG
ncbi:MAG: hypothetical protein U1F65_11085 [Verrucomicrobiota bacterium]